MRVIDRVLTVFAPHECLGCQAEGSLLCAECRARAVEPDVRCYRCHVPRASFLTCAACRPDSPLMSVFAAVKYTGAAKDLVWKLKFGRARSAADEIAEVVCTRIWPSGFAVGRVPVLTKLVITHAPTVPARARQRGYDQAQLIAWGIARSSRLPCYTLLSRRGRDKQVGATKKQRELQARHAFEAIRPDIIRGAHVLLVDDVITTGATLEAAARTLIAAGARRVDAVVFAQA